jgi:hypothetical protein
MAIIEGIEGKETADLLKLFLIDYSLLIAKASKEDWLAFLGMNDSISDNEEKFINSLKVMFKL